MITAFLRTARLNALLGTPFPTLPHPPPAPHFPLPRLVSLVFSPSQQGPPTRYEGAKAPLRVFSLLFSISSCIYLDSYQTSAKSILTVMQVHSQLTLKCDFNRFMDEEGAEGRFIWLFLD